jgi:hypothetical protein
MVHDGCVGDQLHQPPDRLRDGNIHNFHDLSLM